MVSAVMDILLVGVCNIPWDGAIVGAWLTAWWTFLPIDVGDILGNLAKFWAWSALWWTFLPVGVCDISGGG